MGRAAAWLAAAGLFLALTGERRTSIIRAGGGGDGGSTYQGGHGGRHGGGGSPAASGATPGQARPSSPPVVIHMRRYTVPAPQRIEHPENVVRDNRHIEWPRQDDRGQALHQRPATLPPRGHTTIMRNPNVIRSIERDQREERRAGRYYWHDVDGVRYAHYYDRYGAHWYGFYRGPRFYWTRYWGSRWWWYDPRFDRWVYWWNGYWWWPGPTGVAYVYVDNNYYPYDADGVTVENPATAAPPAETPNTVQQGTSATSPDGRRMVQVFGSKADAFLYDLTSGQPVFMKFLAGGVEKTRFSGGKDGKALHIMLEFRDGSFAIFDADGKPMDDPTAAQAGALPTPPPPSTPPPAPPGEDAEP